jgi:separase
LNIKQEMFRVPSLSFLVSLLKCHKSQMLANGAEEQSVFYLLNPSDNLAKTEEAFKSRFEQPKLGWDGVTGRPPIAKELSEALQKKDIYIFFGHGAGTSYYRSMPDNLEGLAVRSASLVIGCSSGRLLSDGKHLESYGTPYRFLLNGSPCYVGVLWDVTDRDIDKFSEEMLKQWMPTYDEKNVKTATCSVSRAANESRSACKLKYLIGAAPVVYGLPVHATFCKTIKSTQPK